MLAKRVQRSGKDWEDHLPYVLFAYRISIQASIQESPFYLLYGRDPRLPGDAALSAPEDCRTIDVRDYKTETCHRFAEAWKLAQSQIKKAQKTQKEYYDHGTVVSNIRVRDRGFVYTLAEKTKAYKFACPFVGPYRVLELFDNEVQVKVINKPSAQPIRVALNRVRLCLSEIKGATEISRQSDGA